MFKRIKRIAAKLEAKRSAEQPSSSRPSSSSFSLRSPIVQELARQVGQGKPAALAQQVADAAVRESGEANVSKSSVAALCFLHLGVNAFASLLHVRFS